MSMPFPVADDTVRSHGEIEQLRAGRGRIWRGIRAIHRRRPLLTAAVVLAAPAHTLFWNVPAYDLIGSDRSWRFLLAWALMAFGFAIRLWGSGNLRKNQEITDTGIYRVVRHPLYLGSLSFFLAFFLTATDPWIGITLFVILVAFVYYPTMLAEEEYLALKFPHLALGKRYPWRLVPDPRRLPEAFASDRFGLRSAYANLGFRGLWFLLALPLFLRVLSWIQGSIG